MKSSKPDVVRQPLAVVMITFAAIVALAVARVTTHPRAAELAAGVDMPLGELIDGGVASDTVRLVAGIIMMFLCAVLLTRIVMRYSVSAVKTYLPIVTYTMTACGIFIPVASVSASVLSLMLILSCGEIIAAFKRSYQFGAVFRSTLLLGLMPLIYSPATILLLMVPVTMVIYRRTVRETVTAIVGAVLPFVLFSTLWWIASGREWLYLGEELWRGVRAHGTFSASEWAASSSIPAMAYVALCAAILLVSVVTLVVRFPSLRVRPKKIYIHFIWLLLCCVGMFVLPSANILSLCLVAVPAGLLSTVFFAYRRGWLSLVVYLILLGLIFAANLAPVIG